MSRINIGTKYLSDNTCEFTVWSPYATLVELKFVYPAEFTVIMDRGPDGYWSKSLNGIHPGFRYFYIPDGTTMRPDPASCFQPEGVHGPSEVVDHREFKWSDSSWKVHPRDKMIIYEIHTGTFTPEGTFDAIIPKLQDLVDLGITAIELMPVSQFPGSRNWGYDGVYPFAVQNSYGGPDGLKRLCNACHSSGLALFLDVVYNHFGPEGNYCPVYGPYLTSKYKTPWGDTLNFDGEYSNGVRNYFIMNALHWFENYHIDGLRLDAVHGIYDFSAKHILEELAAGVREYSVMRGRPFYLIAESDLNDRRIVSDNWHGGYGIDAQWSDDFHHSVHSLLTGESVSYYRDFGRLGHLQKAIAEGFVYSGGYSEYRKKNHGSSSADIPGSRMVVAIQNHDQVGNRMHGERLTILAGFEAHKLAAGTMLVSPYIPLLFMGEEHAETAPFLYFTDFGGKELAEAVRRGRLAGFGLPGSGMEPPDPQSGETFEASKPDWSLQEREPHAAMLRYYRKLIQIRKGIPAVSKLTKKNLTVSANDNEKIIILRRKFRSSVICALMNYDRCENLCIIGNGSDKYTKQFDSADTEWLGPGASAPASFCKKTFITLKPYNFVIYTVKETR